MRRLSWAWVGLCCGCGPTQEGAPCTTYDEVFVYLDADDDGYGTEAIGYVCTPGPGESTNNVDCDDNEPSVNPLAMESCDGLDNDCNGRIDDGFPLIDYYPDMDGDGFGLTSGQLSSCVDPGADWALDPGDCNDDEPTSFPGGIEVCGNEIDEDCDNRIDDAVEQCNDGFDNNCDELVDCDDPSCVTSDNCRPPCADETLPSATPTSDSGSTSGKGDNFGVSCTSSTAPDVAYNFTAPSSKTYTIDTNGSSYDTVLHVYAGCNGQELACDDDGGASTQSEVRLFVPAGDTIIIVVDGYSSNSGNYVLNVR